MEPAFTGWHNANKRLSRCWSRILDGRPPVKLRHFLVFVLLMLVPGHVLGRQWGVEGKAWLAAALLVLSALLTLALRWFKGRNDPDAIMKPAPTLLGRTFDELSIQPKFTGFWWGLDGLLGILASTGPVLLVAVLRGDALSWEAPFTPWHFLGLAIGAAVYLLLRGLLWRALVR